MKTPTFDEPVLLAKMVQGDADAFGEIYAFYQRRIRTYAYRLTKVGTTADEMTQDVFVQLWEKRAHIEPSLPLEPYLRKITQNLIFNFFRQASRDRALLEKVQLHLLAQHRVAPESLLEQELEQLYQAAIQKLPAQKKTIYTLSRTEELSYEEIAERLHLSRHTVRNHMTEAIQFIRRYVRLHTDTNSLLIMLYLLSRSEH